MKLRSLKNQKIVGIIPIIEDSRIVINNIEKNLEYGSIHLIKEVTLVDSNGFHEVLFEDDSLFELNKDDFEIWKDANIGKSSFSSDCNCN